MRSTAVVAVFAAGVVGGGAFATHEAFRPAEHVQVRYVTPASDATATVVPDVVPLTAKPTPTSVPVKVVKPKPVKRVKVAVSSKKVTTRKATVQKSEADVSEPTPEPTILPPPVGPADAPAYTAPTGVFGTEVPDPPSGD